jgi:hypothetical protein
VNHNKRSHTSIQSQFPTISNQNNTYNYKKSSPKSQMTDPINHHPYPHSKSSKQETKEQKKQTIIDGT